MDRLEALEPTVPPAAHDELVAAADAVVAIDDDASATCPSCGGAGVVNVPISLTSAGLLPATPPDPATGTDGKGRTSGQDGGGPKAPPLPLPTITGALPTLLPSLPPAPDRVAGAHPAADRDGHRAAAVRPPAVPSAAAAAADDAHHAAAAAAAADRRCCRRCRRSPRCCRRCPRSRGSGLGARRGPRRRRVAADRRHPALTDGAQPKTESRSISNV